MALISGRPLFPMVQWGSHLIIGPYRKEFKLLPRKRITVVVGPVLGGVLIPGLGMAGAYALIAFIYLVDVVVLAMLPATRQAGHHAGESPLRSLIEGLRYVRGNRTVLVLLVIACFLNLLAVYQRLKRLFGQHDKAAV